jgi:hydrogenase expression/formation protein HypC
MCLGIPGQLLERLPDESGLAHGRVQFGGIVKKVCLSFVPEAQTGDYVVVHAGFAISKIDEEAAKRVFELIEELPDEIS